jgi:hypothetical protein
MKVGSNWIRRRWMEGRTGNSVYLLFTITMINFILISYRFVIEQDPIFEELLPNLWMFIVIFLVLYFPGAIIIGRWHNLSVVKVETWIKVSEQPVSAKMFRILLDIQTGRASKEEIEEARKMITDIETSKK